MTCTQCRERGAAINRAIHDALVRGDIDAAMREMSFVGRSVRDDVRISLQKMSQFLRDRENNK